MHVMMRSYFDISNWLSRKSPSSLYHQMFPCPLPLQCLFQHKLLVCHHFQPQCHLHRLCYLLLHSQVTYLKPVRVHQCLLLSFSQLHHRLLLHHQFLRGCLYQYHPLHLPLDFFLHHNPLLQSHRLLLLQWIVHLEGHHLLALHLLGLYQFQCHKMIKEKDPLS